MIVESIIISIGGVVIMACAGYYFYKLTQQMINDNTKRSLLELKKTQQSEITKLLTPVKLQAYERLVMFLERIKPENLVIRCYQYGMDTSLLKDVMLKNIRDEFEYNLSQQLYVSEQAWTLVKQAKEETIALINSVASSNADKSLTPTDFSAIVFQKMTSSVSPVEQAQKLLKQEIDLLK
ncbi:MAG: hypothetical protein LBR17_01570 [Bacteroidales bacterium]|jgi:hypothetical protein|nr:hypothetical protein [Bacteroidales bacterium]